MGEGDWGRSTTNTLMAAACYGAGSLGTGGEKIGMMCLCVCVCVGPCTAALSMHPCCTLAMRSEERPARVQAERERERPGTNSRHLFHRADWPPTVSRFDVPLINLPSARFASAQSTRRYLLLRGVPPSRAASLTSQGKTLRSNFFSFLFRI